MEQQKTRSGSRMMQVDVDLVSSESVGFLGLIKIDANAQDNRCAGIFLCLDNG